ncbi:MAG TPA: hypothetical protein VGS15_11340 [Candidatus Acidoferrales bacterium]|nr:hypothetical protein [Candidatus Acidoferrales bacterium]
MNDDATSTVILSERSLPAVAGESKDLYLTRHAHTRNERDPLEGGVSDGSAETRATV